MGKGISHVLTLFVIFGVFMLILVVLPIGARQFNYLTYGKCVADTVKDVDLLIEMFKKTRSTAGVALPVLVTDCVDEIVFTNKNWRSAAKDMKEVKCKDDADAHILIFNRDISYWSAIKSGQEKTVAKVLAPDVVCRNIYGLRFNILPPGERLEGPTGKDASVVYCAKFQINPTLKYIDMHSWDIVEAREKCVIS